MISNKLCIYVTEKNAINNRERQKKRTNEISNILIVQISISHYMLFYFVQTIAQIPATAYVKSGGLCRLSAQGALFNERHRRHEHCRRETLWQGLANER